MSKGEGNIILGMLMCWAFNIVHLGIGVLILMTGQRTLATALILILGIGLLQIAYVIPVYRLLRKRGKPMTARGLVIAASITALLNATCWGIAQYKFKVIPW
jgi:hypothetical protein